MAKSALTLLSFYLYMKSKEENRGIIMYTAEPEPCEKCGEVHLTLREFYYHYN